MSATDTETNKRLLREGVQAILNEGDFGVVERSFAPGFVDHDGSEVRDRDGFIAWFTHLREAFPDGVFTIEQEMAEGDYVLQRVAFAGTQVNEFNGVPPTGRRVRITGFDLFRLEDGIVQEHWAQFDSVGMLRQLGVLPPADAGPFGLVKTVAATIGRGVAAEIKARRAARMRK